jgi:hypothetical protein
MWMARSTQSEHVNKAAEEKDHVPQQIVNLDESGPILHHETEAVVTPCRKPCTAVKKKAQPPKNTPFFAKSSVSPFTMPSVSFDHPDNLQPGTPTSSQ